MSDERSVSRLLAGLKVGDEDAAAALWMRYKGDLLRYARRRLSKGPRRVADEEDVALSAFKSLCRGAKRGAFAKLDDRSDLWQLLMVLSARKAQRQIQAERRAKRGGGKVRHESSLSSRGRSLRRGLDQLAGPVSSPEFMAILEDELARLMRITGDDALRQIALLKLQGCTNQEISDQTGRALRSVERKLRLIRGIWEHSADCR